MMPTTRHNKGRYVPRLRSTRDLVVMFCPCNPNHAAEPPRSRFGLGLDLSGEQVEYQLDCASVAGVGAASGFAGPTAARQPALLLCFP